LPTVAGGSEVVVITREELCPMIEIQSAWLEAAPPAETCTVKTLVPPRVGVPEITPEEGFRLSPVGSAPAVMDHA